MSTWKKADKVNQKTHRERQQLRNRSHLGFLEKKQDYKRRANYENEKKRLFKTLKKKALNKNPDEFYYHMVNSKTIKGIHRDVRKEEKHTPEQIALMQTRDLKYINARRTTEKKKISKLKSELHFIDKSDCVNNTHVFYLDSDKEAENFNLAERLKTHPSLVHRKSNRPRLEDLQKLSVAADFDEGTLKKLNQKKMKRYTELDRRMRRERELSIVQRKLEVKKFLTQVGDSKPKKIKSATKTSAPVYKWKQERKK